MSMPRGRFGIRLLRYEEVAMFRHILIPTDGSALSRIAVEKGVALARTLGARVTILTIIEPFHVLSAHAK